MRKIAAILLLLVFVFNLFGYRLFVSFMVSSVDQSLEISLDNNDYNEAQLISIKKPINLPYYNNAKDFTRAYGEVEMNGVHYKYVKSRIYNDSLEMLCIPNTSKQQLLESKDKFTDVVFDIQKNANKKSSNSHKVFSLIKILSEFERHTDVDLSLSYTSVALQNTSYYKANSGVLHKATIEQPPDCFNS